MGNSNVPALTNRDVARLLLLIADLMEISGEESRRAGAYRRAAQSIDSLDQPIAEVVKAGGLKNIRGVGQTIAAVVKDIVATGTCPLLDQLRSRVPDSVLELLRIPGVGPRTVHAFVSRLGVETLDQLQEAAEQGRIQQIPGFGPKREENILRELEGYRRRSARTRYAETEAVAMQLVNGLAQLEIVQRVTYAGSLRRRTATAGNIDLVASVLSSEGFSSVIGAFGQLPEVEQVLRQDASEAVVRLTAGMQGHLRVVTEAAYPVALQYYTGSRMHNEQLRDLGRKKGFRFSNSDGLYSDDAAESSPGPLTVLDEHQLYGALGLPYIFPELRQGTGEIEAALADRLPELVKLRDLKGDLHIHSTWSDGRQSIEEMHRAAAEKGYEYLAVTDHSVSLAVARGLDQERLLQQAETIYQLREQLDGPYLLAGTEVDILADGALDFSDEILAQLDIVVASVHSRFTMGEKEMTRRIIRALENPHVDILAHPTGRVLGYRDGYQVDMEAVLEAAARTGTVVEINASPERLDLPDRWARRALELGVQLVVNSDAHSAEGLDFVRYGIYVARRGWAQTHQIINTWPLDRLIAFLRLPKAERLRAEQ